MKKGKLTLVLVAAAALCGGVVFGPYASAQQTLEEAQAAAQAQQASPWKDRAEYDAFTAITQATDPNQRVELTDKYLAAYPETKFRDKVFEFRLQSFQQLNNTQKMEETATELLKMKPDHFPSLYMLSYMIPRTINAQDPMMQQKLTQAVGYASKGLQALPSLPAPEGVSPDAYAQQKKQSEAVFHQTIGFVALQNKDYSKAERELRQSAEIKSDDALGFYWLGLSYLSPKPAEYDQGMWALARAVSITGSGALPAATQAQVKDYLTKVYEAQHGSAEGLSELLADASSSPFPAAGFHVATVEELTPEPEPEPEPPPPPPPLVTAEELGTFDDIVKYLQSGGEKEEATWELLKGQSLTLPGRVVADTPAGAKNMVLAVSPKVMVVEDTHDVELSLSTPLSTDVKKHQDVQFQGKIDSYRANPFVLRFVEVKVTP